MPISSTPPTKDATWATDAGTTLEPSTPKKALGWVLGERPGYNVFNYWMNLVYSWLVYAKNALTELDSTKLDKTTGGVVTGNIDPEADLTRSLGTAGGTPKRWNVNAAAVTAVSVVAGTLEASTDILANGALIASEVGTDTGAVANRLSRRNIPKVHALVSVTSATPAIEWGFNLDATVSLQGSSPKKLRIAFGKDMLDTLYVAHPTYGGNVAGRAVLATQANKATTHIDLILVDTTDGSIVGFDLEDAYVNLTIFGNQNF